jgi:hypothetical protein
MKVAIMAGQNILGSRGIELRKVNDGNQKTKTKVAISCAHACHIRVIRVPLQKRQELQEKGRKVIQQPINGYSAGPHFNECVFEEVP